jgi:nucleoid DNA-binding protein
MENYLLELIRENNRIIIPNFGAFIVSREKGQNILFNNFLSFNDGLLISHICAVEGVNSATATQKVEDYVAHINSALDEKGLFEIEGIGQFTKDDSGVLRFEQVPSDFSGIEDAEGSEEATKKDEDTFSTSDDNDLLDLETIGVEEIPLRTPFVEKEEFSRPDGPAPWSAGSAAASIPSVQEVDNKSEDVPENHTTKENIYINHTERRRPVGLVLLILLILLLLIGSILWFFTDVLDPLKDRLQTQKTEQVVVPEKIEEAPFEEEIEIVEEEVIEEPVVVSTRQHHVIVGSFRDEAKARAQMQVLFNKGYATASILPYEGRFLLSVEWYPSVNKALQRQEALLTELQMENWVLSLTVQ